MVWMENNGEVWDMGLLALESESKAVLSKEPLRVLLLHARDTFPNSALLLVQLLGALVADEETAIQAAAHLGLGLGVPRLRRIRDADIRPSAIFFLDGGEDVQVLSHDYDGTCTVKKASGAQESVQLHRLFVSQDNLFRSFTYFDGHIFKREERRDGYSAWPILLQILDRLIACFASTSSMAEEAPEQLVETAAAIVDLYRNLIRHCPLLAQRLGQHLCIEQMRQKIINEHHELRVWAETNGVSVLGLCERLVAHGVDSIASMRRLDDNSLQAMGMANKAACVAFRAAVDATVDAAGSRAGDGPANASGICRRILRLFLNVGKSADVGAPSHALAASCLNALDAIGCVDPGGLLRIITRGVGAGASR